MGRLQDKVVLITGAARGTGAETARLCVGEGARVVIADVLEDEGRGVAEELGEAARFQRLDVGSEAEWARVAERVEREFGRIDALVNNAAVLHMAAVEETALADYERVVRVNQIGTFLGIRAAVAPMRRAGGGSIVNVSSVDGFAGKNGVLAYAASKWAVRGMTKVSAIELGRFGIRVNAVCPEAGSTDMVSPYIPEGVDAGLALSLQMPFLPYQRERTPQDRMRDVAWMVLFLASDEAASCTGGDYVVDSGNTAGKRVRGAPGDDRAS